MNPVLAREVKERMRGPRAFVALTVYLVILVLVLWAVHAAGRSQDSGFGLLLGDQTTLGRKIFDWLLFVMLVLVMFLVPGLTAGAVTGERERQTLVPLQVTLLSPRQIMWGKVTSSLAFVAVLVVAAAPLLAVGFTIGGISVAQAVRGLVAVLIVGLLLGAMVVGISARVRRVQSATVLAFTLAFLLSVGSFLAFGVAALVDSSRGNDATNPPSWLLAPNPFVFVAETVNLGSGGPLAGLHTVVDDAMDATSDGSVQAGAAVAIAPPAPGGPVVFSSVGGGSDVVVVAANGAFQPAPILGQPERRGRYPMVLVSLASLILLAVAFFWAGSRKLRTPAEVER